MQNKVKNLFVIMTLAATLASLVSIPAQAEPQVRINEPLLKEETEETYDDACCDALAMYLLCDNRKPHYKEAFKRECAYLGSKMSSYSTEELEDFEAANCVSTAKEDMQRAVICNVSRD